MILTYEEIGEIPTYPWGKTTDYARAVEAKVIEKIKAQGVSGWQHKENENVVYSMDAMSVYQYSVRKFFNPLYAIPGEAK